MRNVSIALSCAGLIAAWPRSGFGQDRVPEAEVFFGGSKIWEHAVGGPYHNSGLTVAVTGNFNRFLGLEMDLSKFKNISLEPPASGDYFRFLVGPHFAYYAQARVTPFGHVLVGATRGRQTIPPPYPPGVIPNTATDLTGQTGFTTDLGGGLDVRVFRIFWIRPIQADYLHVSFPKAPGNRMQLSFGVTLRFGTRGKAGKKWENA